MRRPQLLPTIMLLAASSVWAQQESTPAPKPQPASESATGDAQPTLPVPDQNGVYRLNPAITPPVIVDAVPARLSAEDQQNQHPRISVVSAVIGVDGAPTNVQPLRPSNGPFMEAAIAAVQQSRFQPGTLDGKPVPVLVHLRVPFYHIGPPTPRILPYYAQAADLQPENRDPLAPHRGDTPPRPLHVAEAEFSEQARRKKIQGTVLLSAMVNEQGNPTDMQVERSLGYGLDEKALQALSRYRFSPGLRNGVPTPMKVHVEINFRLY